MLASTLQVKPNAEYIQCRRQCRKQMQDWYMQVRAKGLGVGGRGMYLGSRQLEGPQEVGCLLEGWSNCVDLMDKVLNANNVVLA